MHTVEQRESVVVRFAGDSGDGMQIAGAQFAETSAIAGNDLATFPDFPAEIRAPAGTPAGASGFQIHFSSREVFTPGDAPDVLVSMNPAAMKANLGDLKPGGVVLVNEDAFDPKSLEKAGYATNPLEDGTLAGFRVIKVGITSQTLKVLGDLPLSRKAAERAKNFYALGLVYWLFSRSPEHSESWIRGKFSAKDGAIAEGNLRALKSGYSFGETAELFAQRYEVPAARLAPGRYKNVSGNEALAMGLMAAAELAGRDLFFAGYPITPATDILQFLAAQKTYGAATFQAEDEIAAMAAAIGGAYAGALAATATSGPGLALKSEGLSLAAMLEVPVVIADVQRGGPSTGLPTKTEQADLLQAIFGRHGEAPIPVIAATSPADCFWAAIEAARMAIRYMTPVLLLSDGSLAIGAEPWRIPDLGSLPTIPVRFATDPAGFKPYQRNADLARPWALPGTPGLEHRIGGLEKKQETGAVSYDGANHEAMVHLRQRKLEKIAESYPPTTVFGAQSGRVLVIGWGGTFGAIRAAVGGFPGVGHVHLRNLNPLPADLGEVLARFDRILVPELNLGQLTFLLRARYLVDARPLSKMQGKPFTTTELREAISSNIEAKAS